MPPNSQPPPPRPRARAFGLRIGLLAPGPTNSIVDVANVAVGHRTIWRDEPDRPAGRGIARTGVTAIVPFQAEDLFESRVPAGGAVLNGAGEAIGITTIREWGVIESPILLTTSMAIGRAYDGAVSFLVDRVPRAGIDDALMPVVLECDDGDLNDSRTVQVEEADVTAAIQGAAGSAAGAAGARGRRGRDRDDAVRAQGRDRDSASRVAWPVDRAGAGPAGAGRPYTVGVARPDELRLARAADHRRGPGRRDTRGRGLAGLRRRPIDAPASGPRRERGSCAVVVATDAPLLPHQLERVARRAGLGLARAGSTAGHGSGEIFVAFSTGLRIPRSPADPLLTTDLPPRRLPRPGLRGDGRERRGGRDRFAVRAPTPSRAGPATSSRACRSSGRSSSSARRVAWHERPGRPRSRSTGSSSWRRRSPAPGVPGPGSARPPARSGRCSGCSGSPGSTGPAGRSPRRSSTATSAAGPTGSPAGSSSRSPRPSSSTRRRRRSSPSTSRRARSTWPSRPRSCATTSGGPPSRSWPRGARHLGARADRRQPDRPARAARGHRRRGQAVGRFPRWPRRASGSARARRPRSRRGASTSSR